MFRYNIFLLFFIFSLLTSCGFHLQGPKNLAPPLHKLYLQSQDPYGSLARNLKDSLKMSQVVLVDNPQDAETILTILQDSSSQTLLASNGTLQTRQYQLKITVSFEITDQKGRVIVPPQTLQEERPITIQSNQVLGSSNEVNLYYQQMRQILSSDIMNRLASRQITALINSSQSKTASSLTTQ